jgi:proteic killer suppression protein
VEIRISATAAKQLKKVPWNIRAKFNAWCEILSVEGMLEARKMRGFRDEALQGKRWGQRSVRLSRSYRVIYKELAKGELAVIEVLEVNKHEY